jgi:hypothetical protein
MNRFRLRVAVAVITFVIGAGFHQVIAGIARVAIRYDTVVLEHLPSTIADQSKEDDFFHKRVLVISMPDKRELYLGKKFVGTPDDTRELEAELKLSFVRLQQDFLEAQSKELGEKIRLSSGCKMVYIKVYPRCWFPDVITLIEIAKQVGAQYIFLIADSRKTNSGCRGRYLWDGSRFRCFRMDQL